MRPDHYDSFAESFAHEDYFATRPTPRVTPSTGRPLPAMTDAFTEAGFSISVISEPPFSPETPRELLPRDLGDRTAFLCFLFFVLEAL
jgi:hypothetical protein